MKQAKYLNVILTANAVLLGGLLVDQSAATVGMFELLQSEDDGVVKSGVTPSLESNQAVQQLPRIAGGPSRQAWQGVEVDDEGLVLGP